ncbi:MAG: hypothetical protein CMC94_05370 [Flavobacteriales bacterium]|nr:hypothetical protein [Flavobacteriales bacterium]
MIQITNYKNIHFQLINLFLYLSKEKIKTLISVLLLFAILLPSAVKFTHMLEGHECITHKDNFTQIHESEKSCNICDFNFTPFSYNFVQYTDLATTQFYSVELISFRRLIIQNYSSSNKQLRAPPIYS